MNVEKSASPLRIAFVYGRMPFPMMRGDQLTVAHLLAYLTQRGHKVDFYTLDMFGECSPEQKDWLVRGCREVRIYRQGRLAQIVAVARGLLRLAPIQVGLFANDRLSRDVQRRVDAGDYDIVYIYYLRSASAVPKGFVPNNVSVKGGTRVAAFLAMQLSQSLNTRRIFVHEKRLLKKLFYWLESKLMARYEAGIWQRFSKAVLIGPKDVAAVEAVCEKHGQPKISNWIYGAHGTDIDKFAVAQSSVVVPSRVVFSGSMAYLPNAQAVHWFVKECWPSIRKAEPTAELVIQGRDPGDDIRRLDGVDGISITGTVAEVGAYIRSAAVCINPVFAAGGMQNKLIEYMASGKAIVATSVANEGVMAPTDTLVIADTPSDFASAVIDLLRNPHRRKELGSAAAVYARRNWTWESHFDRLEDEFRKALA